VLAVQPRRRRQRDEELAAVGVGAAVGHAQDAGACVCTSRIHRQSRQWGVFTILG
jgi:hypothetical protein